MRKTETIKYKNQDKKKPHQNIGRRKRRSYLMQMNFGSNPQKQTGKNKERGGGEGDEEEESGGEIFIRNKNYYFTMMNLWKGQNVNLNLFIRR